MHAITKPGNLGLEGIAYKRPLISICQSGKYRVAVAAGEEKLEFATPFLKVEFDWERIGVDQI